MVSKLRIAIVDDDVMEHELACLYFTRSQIDGELLSFHSGAEFLFFLDQVSAGAEQTPSLVLLDIHMPNGGGFSVLEAVRSRPQFRDIPIIIMYSNSDNPADIETSRSLGANAYSTKPNGSQDYLALFKQIAAGELGVS